MTLFSIITITQDNLAGLQKTYKSLLCQTEQDFEWIVIDGASTDGTVQYLEDKNCVLTSEPDNGIYDAMNKGLKQAKGTYTLFLNAGDCLATPKTLEKVKEAIQKTQADFLYGDSFEDHHCKKARHHRKIQWGLFTHHQAMFYKTALCEDLTFDTNYQIAADYDFTWQFLNKTQNIAYLPEALCLYETGGLSQQNVKTGRQEQFEIRQNLGIPYYQNILITMAQRSVYALRSYAPAFYWFLKQR